jgi:hypothetical protein
MRGPLASGHAQEAHPHARRFFVEHPPQHLAKAEQIDTRTEIQEVGGRQLKIWMEDLGAPGRRAVAPGAALLLQQRLRRGAQREVHDHPHLRVI